MTRVLCDTGAVTQGLCDTGGCVTRALCETGATGGLSAEERHDPSCVLTGGLDHCIKNGLKGDREVSDQLKGH